MKKQYVSSSLFANCAGKFIASLWLAFLLIFAQQVYAAPASILTTMPATTSTGISVNLPKFSVKFSVPYDHSPNSPTTTVIFKNAGSSVVYYEVVISTNLSYVGGNVDVPIPGPLPDNTIIQVVFSKNELNLSSASANIFTFTTEDIAPFVKTIAPSTEIGLRDTIKNFTLTFSENITKGTGNILFTNKVGTVLHTIGIGTSAVTVVQNKAFVKVPSNWTLGTQFTVTAPAAGFKDATNKNSVAYVSPLYSVYDPSATLQRIGQSPASTDTIASTATTVKFIFNKPILQTGSSNDILIVQQSGASENKFFGSMNASISGNELTMTYPGGYWPSTGKITIQLNGGMFKDAAGNVLTTSTAISFFVKCASLPPVPAPLVGDTNVCASVMTTLTTSTISGVTYDWISSGAAYTPTSGNSYSFYYPNAGNYTISVATRQGPCFSTRMYKTIKVKTPITVAAGISGPTQVTVGTTTNNYYLSTTNNEAANIDSTKWYQDGVYKGTNFNNYFTWNTVGAKQVRVVLKNKCGSIEKLLTVNVVSGDVAPPTITTYAPLNNATGVNVTANLAATFNEPIVVGTGTVSVYTSTGAMFASYTLPSANVTISGSTMTINPSADLAAGTIYYVNISAGAVKDAASNNFAGITNATTWRFTTASAADVTLPTATVFLPTNLATGVAVGANLVLGFSENITAGTGTIEIREKATGITFESFVMPSAKVTFSGSSMTINPTNDLGGSKAYYVYIPNGAVKDLAGNNYAGILNELSWSFTTVATVDATPPTLLSFIPANNATNVEVNANMVLVFSEPITKVAAKIVQVYKVNGSVVVGNYTTDSPELTLSGNTLTINPSLNLDAGTLYSVYIVGGAFQDAAGNLFAGLTNSNTWKFTTSTITGLDNETANQNISVMPNPVENMLTIQTEGFISAELYDIAGVKVANGNTTTMNISELPAGVYILNVNSTNGNFKKQIVKK